VNLSSDELGLLLYLETRAVDHSGQVDMTHMNEADVKIVERWAAEDFISFGRVASDFIGNGGGTSWVVLSEAAWVRVAAERKARAARTWEKRSWLTTSEKRIGLEQSTE